MEKERIINAPDGCEIEKVELVDGVAVVTFREKKRKLPKSWEEFCAMFPIKVGKEFYINTSSEILSNVGGIVVRNERKDKNILPDRATAEAVLALCQLIQLRNAFNGDWLPDWKNAHENKYTIALFKSELYEEIYQHSAASHLFFKTKELRDEFLKYFRPLIEKLKPLYGIKEGGAE